MRVELAFEFVGELCSVYKFGVEHMGICEGVAKEVVLFYGDHLRFSNVNHCGKLEDMCVSLSLSRDILVHKRLASWRSDLEFHQAGRVQDQIDSYGFY